MHTWYQYRDAWAARPWLVIVAVLAVVFILVSIVGTVASNPLALFFIPGLALLYMHHLLVQRMST